MVTWCVALSLATCRRKKALVKASSQPWPWWALVATYTCLDGPLARPSRWNTFAHVDANDRLVGIVLSVHPFRLTKPRIGTSFSLSIVWCMGQTLSFVWRHESSNFRHTFLWDTYGNALFKCLASQNHGLEKPRIGRLILSASCWLRAFRSVSFLVVELCCSQDFIIPLRQFATRWRWTNQQFTDMVLNK